MILHKRTRGKLSLFGHVTPGIAGKLMGCSTVTFRKIAKDGTFPYKFIKNGALVDQMYVQVGDIIRYCIMNNLPFDATMINMNDLHELMKPEVPTALLHAVEPSLIESNLPDEFKSVNLHQLFKFTEVNPYTPVVIGAKNGPKYAEQIVKEIRDYHIPWSTAATKFIPTVLGLVKENRSAFIISTDITADCVFNRISEVHDYLLNQIRERQK